MKRLFPLLITIFALFSPALLRAEEAALEFEISYDPAIRSEPFSGRVWVFMTDELEDRPPRSRSWTSRQPMFAAEAKGWKAGEPLRLREPMGFPYPLAELPAKRYRVRAEMQADPFIPHGMNSPGNLHSEWAEFDLDPVNSGVVKLRIDQQVRIRERKPNLESRPAKIEFRSECLSQFHGRDVFMRATVLVPEEYDQHPDQKYPAIYSIPGFGGNDRQALGFLTMFGQTQVPFIQIGLDPTTPLGHSVFADSDNNGPWGRALTTEFIPHLESKFRLLSEARGRYLTGHSSGGWSSLWLQVTYPDFFGGTWSGSPDSVTFDDFCGINLYDPEVNFLKDASGDRRPIMRENGQVRLYLDDFARMEDVLGPGGQIHAFESVFGPRGPDGKPKLLFDRKTGAIDRSVVEAWKRYDIVKMLEEDWSTLGPKLAGKITVIMGEQDNFYLAGATKLLKETLERLGSDARIFIEPNLDHGSILMSPPYRAILTEMSEKFRAAQPAGQPTASQPAQQPIQHETPAAAGVN